MNSEAANVSADIEHAMDTSAQQHSCILSKAVFPHCNFMDLHSHFLDASYVLKRCASAAHVICPAHCFALLVHCKCAS